MSISPEFDDVLRKLAVISNIKNNHKIILSNYQTHHKDNIWAKSFIRWWYGATYEDTLNFIIDLIDETIELLNSLDDPNYIKMLISSIIEFKKSVDNMLNNTYKDNIDFTSRMKAPKEKILLCLEEYSEYVDPKPFVKNKHKPIINKKKKEVKREEDKEEREEVKMGVEEEEREEDDFLDGDFPPPSFM